MSDEQQATDEVTERTVLPPLDVDEDTLRRGVAAVLFIADEPLAATVLAETLGVALPRIESALAALTDVLAGGHLGFELREVAGGWRLMTATSARPVLERWLIGGRHGRLTQAALETLAVVAYRQPIARVTIGEIRGVNPDGALRSLVSRGLVTEVGREEGPGQAVLFGTTPQFLERMGLRSLDELPRASVPARRSCTRRARRGWHRRAASPSPGRERAPRCRRCHDRLRGRRRGCSHAASDGSRASEGGRDHRCAVRATGAGGAQRHGAPPQRPP